VSFEKKEEKPAPLKTKDAAPKIVPTVNVSATRRGFPSPPFLSGGTIN